MRGGREGQARRTHDEVGRGEHAHKIDEIRAAAFDQEEAEGTELRESLENVVLVDLLGLEVPGGLRR